MQRHRAGRLAVLLSLNKIDSKPDGVARTACVQPGAQLQDAAALNDERTPSTVGLMAPSASDNSMEGSEKGGSSRNLISGRESQPRSDTMKPIQEEDSGLEMRIDITQAANVLRLGGINEECSSVSDDSGIQVRETAGIGSNSPNHDGSMCAEPPCGVEPNGAGCDQSCTYGQDAVRIPSAAQLLRRPSNASNDYLGKPSSYVRISNICVCAKFVCTICGLMLILQHTFAVLSSSARWEGVAPLHANNIYQ